MQPISLMVNMRVCYNMLQHNIHYTVWFHISIFKIETCPRWSLILNLN